MRKLNLQHSTWPTSWVAKSPTSRFPIEASEENRHRTGKVTTTVSHFPQSKYRYEGTSWTKSATAAIQRL